MDDLEAALQPLLNQDYGELSEKVGIGVMRTVEYEVCCFMVHLY